MIYLYLYRERERDQSRRLADMLDSRLLDPKISIALSTKQGLVELCFELGDGGLQMSFQLLHPILQV